MSDAKDPRQSRRLLCERLTTLDDDSLGAAASQFVRRREAAYPCADDDHGVFPTHRSMLEGIGSNCVTEAKGPVGGAMMRTCRSAVMRQPSCRCPESPHSCWAPSTSPSVGYVAEEFFISGTASSYSSAAELGPDGRWSVTPSGAADFTTRIVVLTPSIEPGSTGRCSSSGSMSAAASMRPQSG